MKGEPGGNELLAPGGGGGIGPPTFFYTAGWRRSAGTSGYGCGGESLPTFFVGPAVGSGCGTPPVQK